MPKSQQLHSSDEVTFVLGGLTGGGGERVAVHLMNYWTDTGRAVKLISMRGPEHDFYPIPENIHRTVLGGEGASGNKLTGLIKNIFYIRRLRKAIKKAGTPIIISFLTRANVYTTIACFGLGKHVVISERNDTTKQTHSWPWSWLRKKVYKYADVVTANSSIALESMKDYVPGAKLVFVPNPVIIPQEAASPGNSTKILNVARLTSHKEQALIIEALARIGAEHQDWIIQILGEGEERENLIRTAEKKELSDRIELPGFVRNPSVYYRSAACFVLPSLYEGTPNALLEAMAHGLPSIVSDSLPGALELVEDGVTGLVFRSGDVVDLAQKLNRLIKNPDLRVRLGAAARKRMEEFTPQKAGAVWEKVLTVARER